jgi:hypothetical protein
MTESNITSAFAKPGIHPLEAPSVLEQVSNRPITPPDQAILANQAALTIRRLRKTTKVIYQAQKAQSAEIQQLIITSEKLVIRNEILEHENRNLKATLVQEKKRRARGKPIGLIDKEGGEVMFFSPGQITKARERTRQIKEVKARDEAAAVEKKMQAQLEKDRKAEEILRNRKAREERVAANKAAAA